MEYLFDTPDFAVAEALLGMQYHLICTGNINKGIYYNTMASEICKELSAFNSSVYARCLVVEFLFPTTSLAVRKQLLLDYVRLLSEHAYYDHQNVPAEGLVVRRAMNACCRIFMSAFLTFEILDEAAMHGGTDVHEGVIEALSSLLTKLVEMEQLATRGMLQ